MSSGDSPAVDSHKPRTESEKINSQLLLGDRAKLRKLETRSDLRGLLHFGPYIGLIVIFAYMQVYSGGNALTRYIFLCLQTFMMAFMFTGMHECSHNTAFKTKAFNKVLGHVFGFLTFRPLNHYIFYHYNHHKFTGDPALDPEMQDSFIDLKLDNPFSYVMYLTGLPFWLDRYLTIARHGILGIVTQREMKFLVPSTKAIMLREARLLCLIHITLAAVIYFCYDLRGSSSAVAPLPEMIVLQQLAWGMWHLWLVPTWLAQPFLRFYLVAEHTGCPIGDNMLSNTRTTKTFWWYRWLAFNMPFHAEHHAYPAVPFHSLPALHQQLRGCDSYRNCDPNGENGYLGVHIGIVQKFLFGK